MGIQRRYHLRVVDFSDTSSDNSRINVSRNRPIAFVVGVAGFLGSYVAEYLISKGIQVIGLDDLSTGSGENLIEVRKSNNFHFLNASINEPLFASLLSSLSLPRIDYAFFLAGNRNSEQVYNTGLLNFLYFIEKHSKPITKKGEKLKKHIEKDVSSLTKIVFSSSIALYNDDLSNHDKKIKQAEILFAKFCKQNNLNGRVVRHGTLFGPRMHFQENDPLIKLIQSAILDRLEQRSGGTEFVTQGVYVEDAAELMAKSVLAGSTANKIYDCLRAHPIYISELQQLLSDPLWFEERGFKPTLLPEWLSPNLKKTMKELSWHPKTAFQLALANTMKYFRDHKINDKEGFKEAVDDKLGALSHWSFNNPLFKEEQQLPEKMLETESTEETEDEELDDHDHHREHHSKRSFITVFFILALIVIGLVLPVFQLVYGSFMIKQNLKLASEEMDKGSFDQAFKHLELAGSGVKEVRSLFSGLALAERLGIFDKQIAQMNKILDVVDLGVSGINHSLDGTKALYETTRYISGGGEGDVRDKYDKAQVELTEAQLKLQLVQASLEREDLANGLPGIVKERIGDLQTRVGHVEELVEKARAAAFLMPNITALDGKKSYLVLLQNNLELRPGGGFIGSYAKITFEKGKIADVKVDDVYNLDGQLKDVIEPPEDLKKDLGQQRWYLRDSNSEPDFPTSARQAELFYRRESGEIVNGVIALNLSASAKLVDAVGGIDLPEYGEAVTGENLFAKTVSKAEGGFFPGSQAKKNYLTALQSQLFNKIFYLSKQNWPAIITAIGKSLEEKQLMVYLADPTLFSYALSENWGGVLPRGIANSEGSTGDFLAIVESNMGANKANYYLDRQVSLITTIGKEGEIGEKLTVSYKNNSPADVFPGGTYKNRFKVYLPLGTKLNKVVFGETDITSTAASFTDYGRSGYSFFIELLPQEQKNLVLEYGLNAPLSFKDGRATYRLDVIKQSGWLNDPLEWKLNYPINMYVQESNEGDRGDQQIGFTTDFTTDRAFQITLEKR